MKKIVAFRGQYRFLSNFWPAEVELDGYKYPTVEHAYQAAKTLNADQRAFIRCAETPGRAKRLGAEAQARFGRDDWETIKLDTMRDLVEQKFKDPKLADKLVATANARLEEGNHWGDHFWGVCNGVGSNHLGNILMVIRSDIINERAGALVVEHERSQPNRRSKKCTGY